MYYTGVQIPPLEGAILGYPLFIPWRRLCRIRDICIRQEWNGATNFSGDGGDEAAAAEAGRHELEELAGQRAVLLDVELGERQDGRRDAVRHLRLLHGRHVLDGAVHDVLVLHLHQRPREVDDALDTRDCRAKSTGHLHQRFIPSTTHQRSGMARGNEG